MSKQKVVYGYSIKELLQLDIKYKIYKIKRMLRLCMKQWVVLYDDKYSCDYKGLVEAKDKKEALKKAKARWGKQGYTNIRIQGEY